MKGEHLNKLVWDRVLTDLEIKEISTNPYQIFKQIMSIEQQIQQAIEEFGSLAYKRFTHRYTPHYSVHCSLQNNNDFSDYDLQDIKLKSLPELFSHDIKVYGDDAYLMWEINYKWILDFNFSFNEIYTIECAFGDERSLINRKKSAALPFDIERAKAGNAFEYFERGEWHTKTSIDDDFIIDERYLRMKYPRKLK